jgi:hypothetical protein
MNKTMLLIMGLLIAIVARTKDPKPIEPAPSPPPPEPVKPAPSPPPSEPIEPAPSDIQSKPPYFEEY